MRTVQVVQRVALVHAEPLEILVGLGLRTEVEQELGVVLIAVADLDAQTTSVPHLLHLQALQADHTHGTAALAVGVSKNENIFDEHPIDGTGTWRVGKSDATLKGAVDAGEEAGLAVAVAPDIDVEAGVVAFEEFAV